jgi:branched-chain amino acid transport system ATP-binding protein
MLNVKNLRVHYGAFAALQDVSLTIEEGRIVSIVGANGAGKTTLINAISGLLRPVSGDITFEGQNLLRLEGYAIASMGVAQVPEGRKLFGDMTVHENLLMGSYSSRAKPEREKSLEMVYDLFPILKSRSSQLARTLSGGEQQMLAVGRALMTRGRLMLLDEPSMGLAPVLVREIFQTVREINATGTTILLVEQNARQALKLAHRGYVLETGRLTVSGPAGELMDDPSVKAAYLGG